MLSQAGSQRSDPEVAPESILSLCRETLSLSWMVTGRLACCFLLVCVSGSDGKMLTAWQGTARPREKGQCPRDNGLTETPRGWRPLVPAHSHSF